MKTTNQFFVAILVLLLLPNVNFSQETTPKRPEFVSVTTMHWNMDMEDFDMETWKAIEKEYHEKVIMKNEFIMTASTYLHLFTADNTELLFVQTFASWEDMGKFGDRSDALEKEAWPNEKERELFLKKRMNYYAFKHSDEIYAPIAGAKLLSEKPTKDMVMYVRKSHFSFPEDSSKEAFDILRKEGLEKMVNKNEYIKAYYPNVHAWGSDKTEFVEAFFLDSMADLDKMYERNDELIKEGWPNEDERKKSFKEWRKYFTGVHGDYLYTWVHDLSK